MDRLGSILVSYSDIDALAKIYSGNREQAILTLIKEQGAPVVTGDRNQLSFDSQYHWYREEKDWCHNSLQRIEAIEVSWGDPDENSSPAHTSYQAELGYRIDNECGFVEATESVTKHLSPGDIFRCYRQSLSGDQETVDYQVHSITEYRECGHVVWGITACHPNRSGHFYLNDWVYSNGVIRQLFNNSDDTIVRLDNPPPEFASMIKPEIQLSLF